MCGAQQNLPLESRPAELTGIVPVEMPASTPDEAKRALSRRFSDGSTEAERIAYEKVRRFESSLPLIVNQDKPPVLDSATQERIRQFFGHLSTPAEKVEALRMLHSRYVYPVARLMAPELIPPFLHDPSIAVRLEALDAAAMNPLPDQYLPELAGFIEQPNPIVQVEAIFAGRGQVRLASVVAHHINDPASEVQLSAIGFLGALWGQHQALQRYAPEVRGVLKSADSSVREAAMLALVRTGTGENIELVAGYLSGGDVAGTMRALESVPESRWSWAGSLIGAKIDAPEDFVRIQAIDSLAVLHAKEQLGRVLPHLKDPEPRVRAKAAEALGVLGDESVVPALFAARKDENKYVQEKATESILKLRGYRKDALVEG
jgi:HEAT repeat protein